MKIASMALAAALAVAFVAPVAAQMQHDGHGMGHMQGMDAAMGQPKGDQGEASKAFAAANARMHQDMDITFTGDVDVDFVRGMIAHHQGAIDMAKVQLQYGKDPEIRKLSEGIIAAQEKEIADMRAWLKAKGAE